MKPISLKIEISGNYAEFKKPIIKKVYGMEFHLYDVCEQAVIEMETIVVIVGRNRRRG